MSLLFLDQQPAVENIDCLSVDIKREQLLLPMPAVAEIILHPGVKKAIGCPYEPAAGLLGAIFRYR